MVKMKKLVATLGVSLVDAQQGFRFMNGELKKQFRAKFATAAQKVGVPDVLIDSFTFNVDFKHQFDAFDIANLLSGVLNHHKGLKDIALKADVVAQVPTVAPSNFNLEPNFWTAFHQLLDRKVEFIESAVGLATEAQQNIFRLCKEVIEKKRVQQTSDLRYAVIEAEQSANIVNTTIHAIRVLTNLLLRVHNEAAVRDKNKKKRVLPFMIAIFDKSRSIFLVHATHGNMAFGDSERIKKK